MAAAGQRKDPETGERSWRRGNLGYSGTLLVTFRPSAAQSVACRPSLGQRNTGEFSPDDLPHGKVSVTSIYTGENGQEHVDTPKMAGEPPRGQPSKKVAVHWDEDGNRVVDRRPDTLLTMAMTTLRKLLAALAIVGMLASGIGIASYLIAGNYRDQGTAAAPRYTPPTPPSPSVPTAKEFLVGVLVTAQNCDPAGACLYTYTIDPKYVGLHPFPETPFTVEYEVTGGHQPQPGKFTVTGEKAEILKDVTLEGPPGAQLSAKVVRVFEQPPGPVGESPPPGPVVEPAPAP